MKKPLDHEIVRVDDPAVKPGDSGRAYCANCGRNIRPAYRGAGFPFVGNWGPGHPTTFAMHKVTARAVLARRGF